MRLIVRHGHDFLDIQIFGKKEETYAKEHHGTARHFDCRRGVVLCAGGRVGSTNKEAQQSEGKNKQVPNAIFTKGGWRDFYGYHGWAYIK